MDVLLTAVKAHLTPAVETLRRWRPQLRRRVVTSPVPTAIDAAVRSHRAGEPGERATAASDAS